MQDIPSTTLAPSSDAAPGGLVSAPTALVAALGGASAALQPFAGATTFPVFSVTSQELDALIEGAGAFDLGYRGQIAVGGADRVRWLNGMLTNNIQGLAEGAGNYNFVLNAQGRIQGDCDAFRMADHLLVLSDRNQVPLLLAHFDKFIIMDDVATEDISPTRTSLGLAGPLAIQLLGALGVQIPQPVGEGLWMAQTRICGVPVQLTGGYGTVVPRFELWCANENVRTLWEVLLAAGAAPCGCRAAEALRVLEGVPRYGVDLNDRDLPQETGQMRALHFSKGCYLGQEIVERIRSRGNVHRELVQLSLSGEAAELPLEVTAEGKAAGRITSTASYKGGWYGLGMLRTESAERQQALDYSGGTATILRQNPLPHVTARTYQVPEGGTPSSHRL
jgi:folate-binding protein YgfZ